MLVVDWWGLLFSQADERIICTGGVEGAGGPDAVLRLKALKQDNPSPIKKAFPFLAGLRAVGEA